MKVYRTTASVRKAANCDDCPLKGCSMVLPEGKPDPQFVVLDNVPTVEDAQNGRPHLDKSGLALRRAAFASDYRPYFTYNVLCLPRNGKVPEEAINACLPRLRLELEVLKLNRILLLGKPASTAAGIFPKPFRAYREVENRTHRVGNLLFRTGPVKTALQTNANANKAFLDDVAALMTDNPAPTVPAPTVESYTFVTNPAQATAILERMGPVVAVDLETTGVDPYRDAIITIQMSWEAGIGYAFPWELFSESQWAWWLLGKDLVMHNGMFDATFLALEGVHVECAHDTQLQCYLVDERPGTRGLAVAAQKHLNAEKWGHLVSDGDGKVDMAATPLSEIAKYGARDADLTYRLHTVLQPRLDGVYQYRLLTTLQNSLIRTQLRGVRIDTERLHAMIEQGESIMTDLEAKLDDEYGLVNVRSYKQVGEILYDRLGLPDLTGKRATDEAALRDYSDVPFVRDLLEYRHTHRATKTYLDRLAKSSSLDGRYHPEYRIAVTETGRLAESMIVLIPRAEDLPNPDRGQQLQLQLRELFIPDEGHVFVQGDFRSAEVGVAALLSADPLMIEHYNRNIDLHSVIAVKAFDIKIPLAPYKTLKARVSEHHAHERSLTKTGVFATMYGAKAATIARNLNLPMQKAQDILDAIRGTYTQFMEWQDAIVAEVKGRGTLTTPWGQTRRFPFNTGLDRKAEEKLVREAINYLIQNMANSMTLKSFVEAETSGLQTLFLVHDSIALQAPEGSAERAKKQLKDLMEAALTGAVRFEADVKIGPNWGKAE